MNGVIETATGDLIRKGFTDFENDGSFDSGTETYKTDITDGALVKKTNGGDFSTVSFSSEWGSGDKRVVSRG